MIKGSKQIWGTLKGSKIKKRFENSICFTFHLATCYFMYPICKILAKCMTAMLLLLVEKWSKMAHLPQEQEPVLEISYILLCSVMTLHCHRLNQISSFEPEV